MNYIILNLLLSQKIYYNRNTIIDLPISVGFYSENVICGERTCNKSIDIVSNVIVIDR